jgi:hypothetical protein
MKEREKAGERKRDEKRSQEKRKEREAREREKRARERLPFRLNGLEENRKSGQRI